MREFLFSVDTDSAVSVVDRVSDPEPTIKAGYYLDKTVETILEFFFTALKS